MKQILDRDILERFLKAAYPSEFKTGTGLFMASALRRKYMSSEEAARIHLTGEASMIRKRYVKTVTIERVVSAITECLDTETILTANDCHPMESAMVLYLMTGLSDNVKAYQGLKKTLAELDCEALSLIGAGENSYQHVLRQISRIDSLWYTELQKSVKSPWIDFDIDLDDPSEDNRRTVYEAIRHVMEKQDAHCLVVNTHGGIHLLVNSKDSKFGKNFNPNTILGTLRGELGDLTKEIILSKSHMIPCPGTMQAGHLVTFEEFSFSFA